MVNLHRWLLERLQNIFLAVVINNAMNCLNYVGRIFYIDMCVLFICNNLSDLDGTLCMNCNCADVNWRF